MGIFSAAFWGLLLLASKFWLKSLLDMVRLDRIKTWKRMV